MKIKIMQLDSVTNTFKKRHTFLSKEALEFHIKCMGLILPETKVFDKACENGVIYVWNTVYHSDPDELRKKVEQKLMEEQPDSWRRDLS